MGVVHGKKLYLRELYTASLKGRVTKATFYNHGNDLRYVRLHYAHVLPIEVPGLLRGTSEGSTAAAVWLQSPADLSDGLADMLGIYY